MEDGETRDDDPRFDVKQTINTIEDKAKYYESRAGSFSIRNSFFMFLAVILGVGSPTLVTYFAQSESAPEILKFTAIMVAVLAGAITVLNATFRWGDRFGQSSLAALSLQELASSTRLRLLDVLRTVKDDAVPEKLYQLNQDSLGQMYDICRGVVEHEVAIVASQGRGLGEIASDAKTGGAAVTTPKKTD